MAFAFAFSGNAQQTYFVYLQTENGQPFYVKINNKLISSSSEGYIILPDLKDGESRLLIGFPKNEFPEENFIIPVDKKNEGFLLKNFGEKGWQLFNLQTLALIEGANEKAIATVEKKEADPFSAMLASVVKDSSILQDHEAPLSVPAKAIDSAIVQVEKTNAIPDTPASVAQTPEAPPSVSTKTTDTLVAQVEKAGAVPDTLNAATSKEDALISMILNKEDENGLQRIYKDNSEGSDTIRIFFSYGKTIQPVDRNQDSSKNIEKVATPGAALSVDSNNSELTVAPKVAHRADSSVLVSGNETHNALAPGSSNNAGLAGDEPVLPSTDKTTENKKDLSEKKNESQITQQPDQKALSGKSEKPEASLVLLPKEVTSSKVNSDCKVFATNEDFLKLRKKMASEYSTESMIKVARKYLKSKCYSTEQIKDLSYLFLNDEGKYMFFDTAYPFTSDSDQYQTLQSQLTNEYYINRFKAMIRK